MPSYSDSLAVVIVCRSLLGNRFKQRGMSCHTMKQENTLRNTANHALIKKKGEESASL
jgi:hypothetical protein